VGGWLSDQFFHESGTAALVSKSQASLCRLQKVNPFGVSGPISFDSSGRRTNFTLYVVEGVRENVVARWNAHDPDVLTFMRSENDSYDALVKNMQKGVLIVSSRLVPLSSSSFVTFTFADSVLRT
jgi:hypothetical protein